MNKIIKIALVITLIIYVLPNVFPAQSQDTKTDHASTPSQEQVVIGEQDSEIGGIVGEVKLIYDIEQVELKPISDQYWSSTIPVNASGMEIISTATALEPGCPTQFMYWLWMSETGVVDCSEILKSPGPNACRSKAGAEGSLQGMPITVAEAKNDGMIPKDWDVNTLFYGIRFSCRMWDRDHTNISAYINDRTAFALRFSSLDVYNAGRIPQTWPDRAWNVGQDGYNQALWIWDQVNYTQK